MYAGAKPSVDYYFVGFTEAMNNFCLCKVTADNIRQFAHDMAFPGGGGRKENVGIGILIDIDKSIMRLVPPPPEWDPRKKETPTTLLRRCL